MKRCDWCEGDALYEAYHDQEWGTPERSSRKLFELLTLESFQSGLSWITILRKRENFRSAFAHFDPYTVAKWGPDEVESLLENAGIIRHRGKIEATLNNARAWIEIEGPRDNNSGKFSEFVWSFVSNRTEQPSRIQLDDVPSKTDTSEALSKALKSHGFKFCGPTTCYAFMQAAGLVNDHITYCHRHEALTSEPASPHQSL